MLKGSNIVVYLFIFLAQSVFAGQYYSGITGEKVKREDVLKAIQPSQVIIISEQHGHDPHHQNQRDVLVEMSGAPKPIFVGMEHFEYPDQKLVDEFGTERINEEQFLKAINWGGIDFANYRFQVRVPYYLGGKTLALNLPRSITNQVAKGGLESLTADQKSMLPPDFTMGADSLFQRFKSVMKDHVPEKLLPNYFAAHSLWDDTMAWNAHRHIKDNPNSYLVVVVGDFHVAYQDGLIARMKARGLDKIVSISQIATEGLSEEQIRAEILPDATYGVRADFVFSDKD